jgi:hypothetical protein
MELILKYLQGPPYTYNYLYPTGAYGGKWWRPDKIPWKKSKAQDNL